MKRYYYKHKSNGGLMNLKSPLDDSNYIEIAQDEFESLTKASDAQPVDYTNMLKIAELKSKLSATDYQAIKYAEGWLTEEEYALIKAYRQELRNQINELENTY